MGRRDLAGHRRDHHVRRGFVLYDFVHGVGIRSFQRLAGKGELVVGARILHRRYPILCKGGLPPSSKWSNTGQPSSLAVGALSARLAARLNRSNQFYAHTD